jgi:hypothetical protein
MRPLPSLPSLPRPGFPAPCGILMEGSYPLGQIFGEKYDNAAFTLFDDTSFTQSSWTTESIVPHSQSNIQGVWIKFHIQGLGTASTGCYTFIALRPYGTSWGAGLDEMSPTDYSYFGGMGAGTGPTGVARRGTLFVPVVDNKFEWYVYLFPYSSSYRLIIQQIGTLS